MADEGTTSATAGIEATAKQAEPIMNSQAVHRVAGPTRALAGGDRSAVRSPDRPAASAAASLVLMGLALRLGRGQASIVEVLRTPR